MNNEQRIRQAFLGSDEGIRHVRFFALIPHQLVPFMPGFWWKQDELFQLEIEPATVFLDDLKQFLDVPIWRSTKQAALFSVTARDILANPEQYSDHWSRVALADTRYPIAIYMRNGQSVLLDGYHRLLRSVHIGSPSIPAIYPTTEMLRNILVTDGFLGELNEISQFDPCFIDTARRVAKKILDSDSNVEFPEWK